jgi:hypothetical protein
MRSRTGMTAILCAALLLAPAAPIRGQTRQPLPERFRFERILIPGGTGPNRLRIDVPLLAGTTASWRLSRETTAGGRETMIIAKDGLSDLRLYDAANREIPYLLIAPPAPEPLWTQGRLLPVAATKKTSGFELDLGRPLLSDRLRLDGLPAPFLKRVLLEAGGDRSRWIMLVKEGTLFDLPGENLKRLEFEFEPGEYRYFRVTWDDSASARVPLPASASVRLVSAQALPPPLRVPLQVERRTGEPGMSRYRLHLPGPRLPITAIELTSAGENILRKARVSESRLSEGEMVPEVLGLATLWHTVLGGTAAAGLRIPISAPQEAQLELIINDENNPPLEFTSVSAVFAYLPWIYFDSAGKGPLTARFGYPDLAPPGYDLEVLRDSVFRLRTVEAHWGELHEKAPELRPAASGPLPSAGAQIDVSSFRYARKIPPGKPGLNALLLDSAALAHSNLSDLRIAGADGRQIPYLLEKLDEPLTADLPARERIPAPVSQSHYRIRFPYENLPAARLVLTTDARVFRREVYVLLERNPANERQEPWTERIAQAVWSHTDPDAPAAALTLRLPALKTTEARLVVDEGDNSPLPITSVKLLLPAYRMRFLRESEVPLTLYYGRKDLAAPRYDLALLAPRLMGAAAEEVLLAPDSQAEPDPASSPAHQKIIFWAVLGTAVVVLFFLIARLLKKGGTGNPGV